MRVKITDLVLRDGHQSLLATRMLTSDMLGIADKLDRVGFWSLETWGGATFDTCIRYLNEDPWERIRKLKAAMPNTPMQMLLRGQNLLGYRNYADDVVRAFVERAAANGVDVFRIFDALNDPRNLRTAVEAVRKAGKHAQGAISYALSPVHTIESYVALGRELREMGCDSICIKDMAGLLKPYEAYKLTKALKKEVGLPVDVHSHSTTGMSVAALLKGVEAGADIIDTVISSLAMGPSHSPTETLVEILRGTEYDTGLDTKLLVEIAAYFRDVRRKYARFESSFLGADTRILLAQVPGGMISNLESQLREQNAAHRLDAVLEEIAVVQKDFGYPPLVTPTSQIVGTQAVFNVLFGRYKQLTAESRDLLVGRYGRTPAQPNQELVRRALVELKMDAPITERPADLIPNELDKITSELKEKLGADRVSMEDVLTYALFPKVALGFFASRAKGPVSIEAPAEPKPAAPAATVRPASAARYVVTVDGTDFHVTVREEGTALVAETAPAPKAANPGTQPATAPAAVGNDDAVVVEAPVAGTIVRHSLNNGEKVREGQVIAILESMKMELEVSATASGTLTYISRIGEQVAAHQAIARISRKDST